MKLAVVVQRYGVDVSGGNDGIGIQKQYVGEWPADRLDPAIYTGGEAEVRARVDVASAQALHQTAAG